MTNFVNSWQVLSTLDRKMNLTNPGVSFDLCCPCHTQRLYKYVNIDFFFHSCFKQISSSSIIMIMSIIVIYQCQPWDSPSHYHKFPLSLYIIIIFHQYDAVSDLMHNWVAQRPVFRSALRVVKMVLNTQFYQYLWLTIWFHAKKIKRNTKKIKITDFTM